MMSHHQIPVPAVEEEQVRDLRNLLLRGEAVILGADNQRQPLPTSLRETLVRILEHLQEGQSITLIPASGELSDASAADLVGVSHEYMARLLESGRLPFHYAGTHRRVNLRDLLAYKATRDQQRREALDRSARQEMEDGTYEKFVLPEG